MSNMLEGYLGDSAGEGSRTIQAGSQPKVTNSARSSIPDDTVSFASASKLLD